MNLLGIVFLREQATSRSWRGSQVKPDHPLKKAYVSMTETLSILLAREVGKGSHVRRELNTPHKAGRITSSFKIGKLRRPIRSRF